MDEERKDVGMREKGIGNERMDRHMKERKRGK